MMKFKMFTMMLVALMVVSSVSASVIWSDDFEAYDIETSADFSVGEVATGNWTADPIAGSRTFHTNNYGGSNLWISNTDGTSITSAGITVEAATEYAFIANLVAETTRATSAVECTYDLLIGQDAGTAASIIGGPVTAIAHGDEWITDNTYDDQITTKIFTTGTLNAGDQLFISIKRVGTAEGFGAAWFGVDNTSIVVPEPVTMTLLGLGGLIGLRRRK